MQRDKIQRTQLTKKSSVRRDYPLNIVSSDKYLFKEAIEQDVPGSTLLEIENGIVLGNGWVWSDSNVVREAFNPVRMPDAKKKKIKGKLRLLLSSLSRQKAQRGLWVSDSWSFNYYHWLTDTIPRLYLAREYGVSAPLYLPKICIKPKFISASLEMLGEKEPLYIEKDTASFQYEKLYIPTYAGEIGNNHSPTIRAVSEKFRRACGKDGENKRRVYISRKIAPNRKVKNEEELLPILEKYNVEVVCFEQLTFAEQVRLSASAEIILGPHGAGLTNLMFMPEGGKVIEFHPINTEFNQCYFNLSHSMRHSYQYMMADKIDEDSNMTLNPVTLENCLANAFNPS